MRWTTARQSTGLRASSSDESDDTAPGAASSSSSETAKRYFSSTFDIMLLSGTRVDFDRPTGWEVCSFFAAVTRSSGAPETDSRDLSNGYSSMAYGGLNNSAIARFFFALLL